MNTTWTLSNTALTAQLLECEDILRTSYAHMLTLIHEADQRGLAKEHGYRSTTTFLVEALRISRREAKTRLTQAETTTPTRTTSGTSPPPMPLTGEAVRIGAISREHLHEITKILTALPRNRTPTQHTEAERLLLDLARIAEPLAVRRAGKHLLDYLNQHHKTPEDTDREQRAPTREFRYRIDRTGHLHFTGKTDPETATLLAGLFDTLSQPDTTEATGQPDKRSAPQRHGDALAEIVDLAARADELAVQGGERAVITVTVGLNELKAGIGTTVIDRMGYGSISQARRWCCDAKILPAVLGGTGAVLDLGRASRLASPMQKRALAVRDGGCAFPGCTRPPKWCTAHHTNWWTRGGHTNLNELVLLCARHHRLLHHSEWEIRMNHGTPEFLPPTWLDPDRKPLRNTAHPRLNAPPGQRQRAG
ncbi:HNH endonuclease signature motif containing protein [Amycolatopsis anabasis]|uniref:HNH endonuclease signature motif containing protein n=1 Tax=Amycolatopsis anabasis TaxID=1840409 RepID=UPI00131C3FCC|nr:HNH endonuclease signature motif containing protein [Amycolatopsis anabasis]